MNKKIFFAVNSIMIVCLLIGCASTKVKRVKTEETIDLSGRFNDSDARMVSEELIKDCLQGAWLSQFNKKTNRDPVVIVGTIVNRSNEHINPSVFIKNLEQDLINSGKIKFVASRTERPEIRQERKDQNEGGLTDPSTIKPKGRETGADFMLTGIINSVTDEMKGKSVTLYQVNLELVDLTTNRVEWLGQKELKKYVSKSMFSF